MAASASVQPRNRSRDGKPAPLFNRSAPINCCECSLSILAIRFGTASSQRWQQPKRDINELIDPNRYEATVSSHARVHTNTRSN